MNIQENIIKYYPLTNKIDCGLNCYLLEKRKYIVFWDSIISQSNIDQILNTIDNLANNNKFSEWKTLIVVGKTRDNFKKKELVYFNSVDTYVVFYLIDENTGEVYKDDSWISAIGLNYKKCVKKIDSIYKSVLN